MCVCVLERASSMPCMSSIGAAFLVSLVEGYSQIKLKQGFSVTGMVGYVVVACMLARMYAIGDLSKVNIVWSSISIFNAAIIGSVVFGETICYRTMTSMALVMIAILINP